MTVAHAELVVVESVTDCIATEHWALRNLAVEINSAFAATETNLRAAVGSALQLGTLLIKAKACTPKGNWESWLGTNCPNLALSTARAYASFATRFSAISNFDRQRVSALPLREAIRAVTTNPAPPPRQSHRPARCATKNDAERAAAVFKKGAVALRECSKSILVIHELKAAQVASLRNKLQDALDALDALDTLGGDAE